MDDPAGAARLAAGVPVRAGDGARAAHTAQVPAGAARRGDAMARVVGGRDVRGRAADRGGAARRPAAALARRARALLAAALASPPAQYFGRISFMLYLVHIMVFECLLLRLQIPLIGVLGMDRINLAGNVARVLLLPLAFWVSEALVEVLDKRSIALAKRLSVTWATSSSLP